MPIDKNEVAEDLANPFSAEDTELIGLFMCRALMWPTEKAEQVEIRPFRYRAGQTRVKVSGKTVGITAIQGSGTLITCDRNTPETAWLHDLQMDA